MVRKGFPEQATFRLIPEELKLASNREERVKHVQRLRGRRGLSGTTSR